VRFSVRMRTWGHLLGVGLGMAVAAVAGLGTTVHEPLLVLSVSVERLKHVEVRLCVADARA
jgi:hypothetical protein